MDTKHTPAPWKIEWGMTQGGDGHHVIDSRDMGELSIISTIWFNDDGEGETKANARLIAAAPELLDELIEQDKFLGVLAGTVPLSEKDTHRRIAMHRESVRAAIAKATGSV